MMLELFVGTVGVLGGLLFIALVGYENLVKFYIWVLLVLPFRAVDKIAEWLGWE